MSHETLCHEAGRLLQRAAALGAGQGDASRDLVARAVALVGKAGEEELREHFLPPMLATFGALEPRDAAAFVVAFMKEAAEQGPDALRKAIADVLLATAGIEMGER